jgi:hypothetical protein
MKITLTAVQVASGSARVLVPLRYSESPLLSPSLLQASVANQAGPAPADSGPIYWPSALTPPGLFSRIRVSGEGPRSPIRRHRLLPALLILRARKKRGTKLHFKSPAAERRHVLCVGVGGDRTQAARPGLGGAGHARLGQLGSKPATIWQNGRGAVTARGPARMTRTRNTCSH